LNSARSARDDGAYARVHQGGDAVARYIRKLDNRIDVLRHNEELSILGRWLRGRVFDCTIGVGRFVGRLPGVSSYDGMDLSAEFVDFVSQQYPQVRAKVADLTAGIPERDGRFDAVLCLRSLSAIGQVNRILREMLRVARPGGIVVVDYGRRARPRARVRGEHVAIDSEDFDGAIAESGAEVAARYRVDAVLTRAKVRLRIFRFLNGRLGWLVPDWALMLAERCLSPLLWQRQIVVLRKPQPPQ